MMAVGMGADVTVIDRSLDALRHIDECFGNRVQTLFSTQDTVHRFVLDADLVVGSVLIPGASAPKLISRAMIQAMRQGSVLVDVAIDQGGSVEGIRPTTHSRPTYSAHGVNHYAVPNMPGSVPRTSSRALTSRTLPFILTVANYGFEEAVARHPELHRAVNAYLGVITHQGVAESLGREWRPLDELIAANGAG